MTISSWLNFGGPAPPGRGLRRGEIFLAPPYYSSVCVSLSAFFIIVSVAYHQRSIGEAEQDSVKADAADDNIGTFPAVVFHEESAERREHERSDAGAADRHASGLRSLLVEIETDHHDRRQVHQTETDT